MESHHLCVPDECAAITAANAWLNHLPPAGRPYEMGADTSGYAIGGVVGQCEKNNGKLLPLMYISAHLAPHQCHFHASIQELWGLLLGSRARKAELGRIPAINHTDHANIARLDGINLYRIDPKQFRWWQEVVEGGSLLLYRGGKTALHAGPDGISRNPEGRDRLLLATQSEWVHWRDRIRGIEQAILAGECEDDDPTMLTIDKVEKITQKLSPLYPQMKA